MHIKLTLTITFLLGAISSFAQHTDIHEIRNEAWPSNDPYVNLSEVPDQWKDASAVILFQSYQRAYTKKGRTIRHARSLRKRLKIQDNSALEAYSEFVLGSMNHNQSSFKEKSDFLVGEIKVIKADGSSFLINLDEAVDDGEGGKKVALSNLEIGDIIDYYYYEHEAFPNPGGFPFQPVISTLGEEYPILHQNLGFKVSNKFYVNFNTYNGAPEVKTVRNENDETVTYMIEDHNRDAEEHPQWFSPYRARPSIKFQVIQADNHSELTTLKVFTGFPPSKLKQETSISDILNLAKRSLRVGSVKQRGVRNYLNKECKNCSAKEKLSLAYNYFRFYRLLNTYEAYSYLEAGLNVTNYIPTPLITEDEDFVNLISSYLIDQSIDFDILATLPKRYGDLNQVLLAEEISYVVRANISGEYIYLSRFSINTQSNEVPYELQGQEAYVIQLNNTELSISPEEIKTILPETTSTANRTYGFSEVIFDNNNIENVQIQRRTVLTGHNKDFDRSDLVTIYDIILEEQRRLNLQDAAVRFNTAKSKQQKFIPELIATRKKAGENQQELFKASTGAEYEFELDEYSEARLLNTGRWDNSFEYADKFSTAALIKKAGKNYIFEIGKLIGKQMAMDEEQKDRHHDIYMAFARSFKEEIIVNIPVGYTVEGLERLSVLVDNSTGSFSSSAEIKDGKLHLHTLKSYKHSFEPLSNWPALLEFLEAAYELSQEKILLKKTSKDTSEALRE